MTREKRAVVLSQVSLACFAVAIGLAFCARPGGHSRLMNVLELVLFWKQFHEYEQLYWLMPRTVYLFAAWCGFRSYIDSQKRRPGIRIAGALALLAFVALMWSLIFLPTLS